ncbi:MAG: MarR family transcriptional regulator [Firmicutes bacterium]|nr:MarR family transcriptional regulator [Bacillota bacterium]
MSKPGYDALKLENQLCFPLYACAKEVVRQYRPYLDALDLTYTQYIAMMVLWEEETITVRDLGKKLFLDSGTLTPVLKSLESKGFITRSRSAEDERVLVVQITPDGISLRDDALTVPEKVSSCVRLDSDEAKQLYQLLYKVLGGLQKPE